VRRVTVVGMPGVVPPVGLLVGAERHLSTVDTEAERVVLGDIAEAIGRIAAYEGTCAVLASGDPGFFGIVRALRAAGLDVDVRPAPSSVAVAFARVGLPWDDAVVVSAHGRALRPAVNVCRARGKVAVLTGPGTGPAELGDALRDVPRRLVVAERLGCPDERIVETTPAQAATTAWRDPNVVLVLAPETVATQRGWLAGNQPGPAGWALPEAAFAHRDSMITKAEVRALVLARLGPRLGDLVWDVGAGSGSVAVECARFGAAVVAVERDPGACDTIRANAVAHGVELSIVDGSAPTCFDDLPDPDAVYVGGGGLEVLSACARRGPTRIVAGYAAIERVGPALSTLDGTGFRAEAVQCNAHRVVPLPDGTHRLAATNPVYVVAGERR
jgi:precorrin-6B C5,15-methyltransferase / cobalt-precorrin-6B C5,C15-methyltransferase